MNAGVYPIDTTCPHCKNTDAKLNPKVGDSAEYDCPTCRRYRISDTHEQLIKNGSFDPTKGVFVEERGHRWLVP